MAAYGTGILNLVKMNNEKQPNNCITHGYKIASAGAENSGVCMILPDPEFPLLAIPSGDVVVFLSSCSCATTCSVQKQSISTTTIRRIRFSNVLILTFFVRVERKWNKDDGIIMLLLLLLVLFPLPFFVISQCFFFRNKSFLSRGFVCGVVSVSSFCFGMFTTFFHLSVSFGFEKKISNCTMCAVARVEFADYTPTHFKLLIIIIIKC